MMIFLASCCSTSINFGNSLKQRDAGCQHSAVQQRLKSNIVFMLI